MSFHFREVLYGFQRAEVIVVHTVDRKIPHANGLAGDAPPDCHFFFRLLPEVVEHLPDHRHETRRVAVPYLAPQCRTGTSENTSLVDEKAQAVVGVDESDIDGEQRQNPRKLGDCQCPRRKLDLALREKPRFILLVLHAAKRFALVPTRRVLFVDKRATDFRQVAINAVPFVLGEIAQGQREQHLFLSRRHVPQAGKERLHLVARQFLDRFRAVQKRGKHLLRLVVRVPYGLRRPRDAIAIEKRHQKLLSLSVMAADFC